MWRTRLTGISMYFFQEEDMVHTLRFLVRKTSILTVADFRRDS